MLTIQDVSKMKKRTDIITAFRVAFPKTVPILAGFVFLGIAYGFMLHALGFNAIYPILIRLIVFAGSLEFVAANLLIGAFNPLTALFLTLTVNARHLLYGLSMLGNYDGVGKKKWSMLFGLCADAFQLTDPCDSPYWVARGWGMCLVAFRDHVCWVLGAALRGVVASLLNVYRLGLDFVMAALGVVIFLRLWG